MAAMAADGCRPDGGAVEIGQPWTLQASSDAGMDAFGAAGDRTDGGAAALACVAGSVDGFEMGSSSDDAIDAALLGSHACWTTGGDSAASEMGRFENGPICAAACSGAA
ncbi:hypothetical protein ACLOJK_041448 [Asimina triloba]